MHRAAPIYELYRVYLYVHVHIYNNDILLSSAHADHPYVTRYTIIEILQ